MPGSREHCGKRLGDVEKRGLHVQNVFAPPKLVYPVPGGKGVAPLQPSSSFAEASLCVLQ